MHKFVGRSLKYICEKVPLSEPKFSQDLLLPNYAVLPLIFFHCFKPISSAGLKL